VPSPIPGFVVTTPFGRRGESWSCHKQDGKGIHTGDDYSTSGEIGFDVRATADGKVVIVVAREQGGGWGGDYGNHVVIESGDVRHGYCHLSKVFIRVGQQVRAGTRVGLSGNTGNVAGSIGPFLGAHLHYEERTSPFLFCNVQRKPTLSRGPGPGFTIAVGEVFVSRLKFGVDGSDSVRRLQDVLNGIALTGRRLKVTGDYDDATRRDVKAWQVQVVKELPDSPFATGSIPGPRQANRLFGRTGNTVIDDTDNPVS
jgi:murein DD-endopeptidase MepM/ murein hydrolase activator NlpD